MPKLRFLQGWEFTSWTVGMSLLVLLAVAGTLLFGLPAPGFISGSDANFALSMTKGYMGALGAGVPFPRWLPEANAGLGSPAFLFYGRLPFFIAAVLGLGLRLGPVAALLAGFAFFRLMAFCTCRAWLRLHTGSRAADCGALVCIALPFAMSFNPVTRVGFAENAATAFIPLLFLALEAALVKRRPWLPVAALAGTYALLACTHLPQFVLAAAVTMLFAAIRRSGRLVWVNVSGLTLGLLLSAASVAPALLMQNTISPAAWSNNGFLELKNNFLFTAARYHQYDSSAGELELYSTWLLCAALLLMSWRRRNGVPAEEQARWRAFAISLAIVLLCMTGIARPFWLAVHPLRVLQFPWRLFPGALTLAAALAALWVGDERRRQVLCVLFGGGLVLGQFAVAAGGAFFLRPAFQAHHHVPGRIAGRLPRYVPYAERELPSVARMRSFVPEYIPEGARLAGWHLTQGDEQLDPGPAARFLPAPMGGLTATRLPDGTMRLAGSLAQPQAVILPTFYYPDEKLGEGSSSLVTLDASTGLARVDLPAGRVAITLTHAGHLPVLRYGQLGSTLGAVLLLLCVLLGWSGNGMRARVPVKDEPVLSIAAAQGNEFTAAVP